MCGRYGLWTPADELAMIFDLDFTVDDTRPTFNAAPSQILPVIFERFEQPQPDQNPLQKEIYEDESDDLQSKDSDPSSNISNEKQNVRRMQHLQWGLIPHWAKAPTHPMINARAETLLDKPSFKAAARRQRCLVPANGYFEWQAVEVDGSDSGSGSKGSRSRGSGSTDSGSKGSGSRGSGSKDSRSKGGKQPWFLSAGSGDPVMGFAGIFEVWKNPQATSEDDQWLRTFAIITRPAPDVVGHIHDRAPVVVPAELWDDWLSPQIQDDHEIASLLDAIGSPHLHPRRVSKAVGNVRNNNPSLVEEM